MNPSVKYRSMRNDPDVNESNNANTASSLSRSSDSDTDTRDVDFTSLNERRSARMSNLSTLQLCSRCLLVFVCGLIFGVAVEKGRVHVPRTIRSQMILEKFIMLKMFVSAVSAGMFGFSLLAMHPRTQRAFLATANDFFQGLADKGILSSVIGGWLIGAGMAVSGACPVMVLAQVGAGVPNALYTLGGVLFGTLLYGLLKPAIDKVTRPMLTSSTNPYAESPYFTMSLPLVVMFAMLVFAFELLLPWRNEIKVVKSDDWLRLRAWPPYLSGVLVGLLQIPHVIGIHNTLGGSSSYCTIVSQLFVGPLKKLSPFLVRFRWGFHSWWQIFYVSGVVLGAYISTTTSGSYVGVRGVPPLYAFTGGMLLLLGARTAGGCTSGHGLSGMGLLSILSFICVASMFAGGFATAYAMKSAGVLGLYVR